jgi:hypothetical protein
VAVTGIAVEWSGGQYEGEADARPARKGKGKLWDMPDLCVITLKDGPRSHPWVVLGELGRPDGTLVYLAGYTKVYNEQAESQAKDGVRLGAPAGIGGRLAFQVEEREIPHGLSGGPVLDPSLGVVRAITKAQRLPRSSLGGLVIPAELIKEHFPLVWERNQESVPGNAQWYELRDGILDYLQPGAYGLTGEESELLPRVVSKFGLTRPHFNELWESVTRGVVLRAPRAFYTLGALIDELANATTWDDSQSADPARSGLDLITRLFVSMAYARWMPRTDGCHRELLGYAMVRAMKDKREGEFYKYAQRMENPAAEYSVRQPVVVLRMLPDPPGAAKEVKLQAWSYPDRDALPIQVDCPSERYFTQPSRIQPLREAVVEILDREIAALPQGADPVIEFALPDDLLDLGVEDWEWQPGIPLSEAFPVVLRIAERDKGGRSNLRAWRSRELQFRAEPVPVQGTLPWTGMWITCQTKYDRGEINRALRQVKAPIIAMTGWPGPKRVKVVMDVARLLGSAVIIWRRRSCGGLGCGPGNEVSQCKGHVFRQQVADHLSGALLYDLPEKVFEKRISSSVSGTAIIWDDPGRSPWEGGLPMSVHVGE